MTGKKSPGFPKAPPPTPALPPPSTKTPDELWNDLIDGSNQELDQIILDLVNEAVRLYGQKVGPRDDNPGGLKASAKVNPTEFMRALTAASLIRIAINKLSDSLKKKIRDTIRKSILKSEQAGTLDYYTARTALTSIGNALGGYGYDYFDTTMFPAAANELLQELQVYALLDSADTLPELLKLAAEENYPDITGEEAAIRAAQRGLKLSRQEAADLIAKKQLNLSSLTDSYTAQITKTGVSTDLNNVMKGYIKALYNDDSDAISATHELLGKVLRRELNKNPKALYRFNGVLPEDSLKKIVTDNGAILNEFIFGRSEVPQMRGVLDSIDGYMLEGSDFSSAFRRALQQVPLEKNIKPGDYKSLRRRRDILRENPLRETGAVDENYSPWLHTIDERLSTNAANSALEELAIVSTDKGETTYKIWTTQGDDRVRPTHVAADGQRASLDGDFVVGGRHMSRPGDLRGGLAEVLNCRCYIQIVKRTGDGGIATDPKRVFGKFL